MFLTGRKQDSRQIKSSKEEVVEIGVEGVRIRDREDACQEGTMGESERRSRRQVSEAAEVKNGNKSGPGWWNQVSHYSLLC